MKDSRHDQLLHELFEGDEVSALRRSSLEVGLASLKRKRLHARVGKAALLLPVLLAFILVLRLPSTVHRPPSTVHRPPSTVHRPPSTAYSPTPTVPTKIISERELFALFPNRPMALVGKPGHQRLVFLDQPKPQID